MKKKIIFFTLLLIVLLANLSFASYSTVTMDVVEEPVCTIEMGNNSKFEKRLISKDLLNKEVTLQLQVTNNEEIAKPTGEIVLVIDNSDSMNDPVSATDNTPRKDVVFNSAKTLISNLLKDNDKLKIGIVSFSTNTDISKEATLEDASVVSVLSNDITALTNSISNIPANGARTDLESGLSLGSMQFSSESNNKYMIVLTDGVPNVALGYNTIYYGDEVITRTKSQLQKLGTDGINVTTMLTGIKDENYKPAGVSKTFGQIISEIFGTVETPTVGKFYYIEDTQIEQTITNDIYNSLVPVQKSYKDITVTDYFPKEIIDNFNFAYVTQPNIGEISATVNATNNSITWTIPELASGQTATVQYKLKLKENFDSNIVGKILDTNEKVDLSYTDLNDTKQEKTSDVTPKLKLAEPPAVLPKAGTVVLIGLGVIATGLLVFSITKLAILNNNMKS